MRHPRGLASLLATLSLALVLGSCADRPASTAPETEPSASLLGTLAGVLAPVEVLERTRFLDEQVVSAVIGPEGGVLSLQDAGLELVIPTGALRGEVRITITSPAGDLVGYHFEPHGLELRKPARFHQNLNETEAAADPDLLSRLTGAYFEGDLLPEVGPLELLDVTLLGDVNVATLEIVHFSGYVIATN
ncbi:MAG: hypothetical protein KY453_00095 [Gemmatimonadetes bacterium]|nr:hypothetical protein [Gemmatimonadota bacterium]